MSLSHLNPHASIRAQLGVVADEQLDPVPRGIVEFTASENRYQKNSFSRSGFELFPRTRFGCAEC